MAERDPLLPAASSRSRTSPFADARHARRYWLIMLGLMVFCLASTFAVLAWGNPLPVGSPGFWTIATMRGANLVVMLVVAFSQALATVAFQTAANNRIVTPSIMGFEALYTAVQTAAVFAFGAAGIALVTGLPAFLLQAGLMVGFASLLYGWLLSGRFSNLHIMLLVGIVIGGGLGSVSTFLQRTLTPSEFDLLAARLMGNISNARVEFLPYAVPITLVAGTALLLRARRLDVIALGRSATENLGLVHRHEIMKILFLVSVLMAMSTSLIGPMTFLGFLVATLAYQFSDTYDHRLIMPMACLIGYAVLSGAYVIMRNVFYAEGAVTIIIELIGGLVFLLVILRKGRL